LRELLWLLQVYRFTDIAKGGRQRAGGRRERAVGFQPIDRL
jgi:hypothetical protein